MKHYYSNFTLAKFITFFIILQLAGQLNLKSQTYSFTALQGTFTPLTGANAANAIETKIAATSFFNIGFTFLYNGVPYTQIRALSNGYVDFINNSYSDNYYTNRTTSIVPFGDYLSGVGGEASYKTEGTAPNRVFTMEFLNFKCNGNATQAGISFQLKLYETSNRIEFIYRQEAGALYSAYTFIGMSFQQAGSYICLSDAGANPSLLNTEKRLNAKPATGQIYRFTPIINPEPSNHVTGFEQFAPGSISVKWNDATGANVPSRYLIKTSGISFNAITPPVDGIEVTQDLDLKDGTGAVYVNSGKQKFNGWTDSIGNTTVYMKIFPLTNLNTYTNYKTDGIVPQLQVSIPIYEARKLACNIYTANSLNLKWARGSRSNCIVFVKENASGKSAPTNNTTYTANAVYGTGTQIGSTGWYCVYNGTGTAVNVTGLKPYTSYAVHVLEYNGALGAEQYSTTDEPTAYAVHKTNYFNDIGTSFTGMYISSAAWCDYDNDGDLDFIASGKINSGSSTILYRNDGASTFVNSGVAFPAVDYSSLSWGDYDNDGFADLIIAGSTSSTTCIAKIFHNNGNGTFSELITAGLTGIKRGNVVWGDYNNDGFADIFLCGNTGSSAITKIYENLKNGYFSEQEGIKLTGAEYSSSIWADFDNDQDLDLLITGEKDYSNLSTLYRNDGNHIFVAQTGLGFPQITNTSIDAADYDNDGDLDILFTGEVNNSSNISKIFKNTGNLTFQEQTAITLAYLAEGSAKWGDVDNDGDMDILLTGRTKDYIYHSKIYINNGDNTFTEDTSLVFPNVAYSSVAWGDYDIDNDLDLLLTGYESSQITKVYRNEISKHNPLPGEPIGLTSIIDGKVVLKWSKVKTSGVSYNVRVGKTSGAYDIVSPLSSSTGLRRIPAAGNAGLDTLFVLENLKKGTYYWSVQALDFNFAGGSFSPEQTFTFNTDIASNSLSFKNIMAKSVKCLWNRGNGDKCVLFVKENGNNTAVPLNNTTYTANSSFGAGTQIGSSGWYCVYNGDKDSVTVSNLKPSTQYQFHVVEYTGLAGNEVYYTSSGLSNPISQTTSLFSEQNAVTMSAVRNSHADWGDYDNDGYLDLIYCGYSTSNAITKIYHNNRNNTFTELAQPLPGVYSGSVAWGDYDNDGDLDFLLTGYSSTGRIAKVFRNNNGIFQDQTGILLTGVYESSAAWGDYDNDGYLDILLSGDDSNNSRITKIYRNTGNNNFVEQTNIQLRGLYYGSTAWGDYDKDGLLDILLTGGGNSGYFTEVYHNNGNHSFTSVDNSIEEVWRSCGIWGDYDNDGDLDILVAGAPNTIVKIYTNNGNGTFTYDAGTGLTGISLGTVAFGDYDNDGDLDIIESGYDQTYKVMLTAKVFRNNGNKTFTEQTHMAIDGISEGSIIWGDYDNDKDLDIFVCGSTGSVNIAKIYKNETVTTNTMPQAPTGLTSSIENDKIVLKWKSVRTDETPYPGLSYNIKVGSGPGKSDYTGVMANDTVTKPNAGYRRVARMGNGQLDTTFIISGLKKGTYYWSVQAVDNSFIGGAFASEESFVFDKDIQASFVSSVFKNLTSGKCSWIRGNGDKCVVFAKENGTGIALPENNVSYTGNKVFGSGTQIGTTGWFCIYNGDLDTATISGLKANTEYRLHVIEYSRIAGAEVYYTTTGTKNPGQYLPLFSEQNQISLTGLSGNTNAWGDYDNDGDLDLIIGGYTGTQNIAELHQNNGDNTFTKTSLNLGLNSYDDLQWGDYDNDNDLDLLVLSSWGSKVFENTGSGSFTATASFAAMSGGKGEWADLNNDGYKDVIFTTMSETKVYKNNKDKTFTLQTTTLPGVSNHSSIACGDYDNDGDLDILIAGLEGSTAITKVFTNKGDFVFVELAGTNLPGISNCTVDWADMDNDGDLDIVIAGADYYFFTKIYDNNGNNTFTEIAGAVFKELYRTSMTIGDYDNDGYRDLIVSGSYNGDDYYTLLYRNNGNKTYTEVTSVKFPGIQYGTMAWGDYDNDNDLDLFMCGITSTGRISKIFRNNNASRNSRPDRMYYLNSANLNGNDVTIKWNKGWDSKTASSGISYNLYIYNTAKSGYSKSAEAFTTSNVLNGGRLVASFGDIQYSSAGYTIKGLVPGNYKCSMQSIDASFAGGEFGSETSFSILDLKPVDINAGNLEIINTTSGMEYSINSTNGVDGNWNYCYSNHIYFTPNPNGFDLWIRQSDNKNNKRKVATLPAQAAAPSFTINYSTETTKEDVSGEMEYSFYAFAYGTTTGSGKPVTLYPGETLSVRFKGTAANLPSLTQILVIPSREKAPTFTIDYLNEKTAENIPASFESSTSNFSSEIISGLDAPIQIKPGFDLYFRKKATSSAFCSSTQYLAVPSRPSISGFSIDYNSETTNQTFSAEFEYSDDPGMINANIGNGSKIPVIPGKYLYIRKKATGTSFCSNIWSINPKARPMVPSFTIDFVKETTVQSVFTTIEFSKNADMSSSIVGNGNNIPVLPGENLYFRYLASSSNFKSNIQKLEIPVRPEAPANLKVDDFANTFDWDFIAGHSIVSDYEFTFNGGLNWVMCDSKPKNLGLIDVTAGNLRIRLKATWNWFQSNETVSTSNFTTEMKSLEKFEIAIYPSPATDLLYLSNLPEKSVVTILTINGTKLKTMKAEELANGFPIGDISPGFYMLKVETYKGDVIGKFSKI